MNDRRSRLLQLHRLAALALLVGIVYQLGACPCGCLEHNMWVALLGLDSDGHSDAGAGRADTMVHSTDHEHDCTGKAKARYLDNSNKAPRTASFDLIIVRLVTPQTAVLPRVSYRKRHGPPRPPECSLSALQVFQL